MRLQVLESKYTGLDGVVCKNIADIARVGKTAELSRHYLRTSVDYVAAASKTAMRAEAMMEDHKRELDKKDEKRQFAYDKTISDNADMIKAVIPGIVEKIAPYAVILGLLTVWTFIIGGMLTAEQRYIDGVKADIKESVNTATSDMRALVNSAMDRIQKSRGGN